MYNVLNVDYKLLRIRNATQHPIKYYADDPSCVKQLRRNSNDFELSTPDVEEKAKFNKEYILSCNLRPGFKMGFGELSLEMPKNCEIPNIQESYFSCDIIIVSREFASEFRRFARSDADYEILDRLYVVGNKVFGTRENGSWGPIGTTALEKFEYPNGGKNVYAYPYYGACADRYGFREMNSYIEAYRMGRSPSLAAVVMLLNYLPTFDPSIRGNYTYIELYNCVMNEIQKRQNAALMPKVYYI